MANKLKNLSKRTLSKLPASEVVLTVSDYYNNKLGDSYTTFKELLKKNQKGKYSNYLKPVIYFYLGLIEQQKNNIEESKLYFEKAKSFEENKVVQTKAEEILEELNK